ncbi:MAG: aspartate aminotransferase family protein [Rhizomicrobium sp.]
MMNSASNESSFWMPFTDNRGFKAHPRLLASAKDMHYYTPDGRPVLDATAGLWCVGAGHARPRIVQAIQRQAATLDYAPTFQLGHPLVFEFAQRVAELLPQGLDRVFFCNSGSEAVDTALKIALAYQRAIGQGTRTRLIGRERGYHGVGFGGLSVGGLANNRRSFVQLPGADHLAHTLNLERCAFTRGLPQWGAHLADELERIVALHGAETIAAVIVEPVAGSAGVIVPPKGYLDRLREITTRHGIVLIFDEVITAFGRLGAASASHYFGITPDIVTCAKGLTNAAVPMGAAIASRGIYDAIIDAAAPGIEFFHGYTYSGHPLAAAAGLATFDVYRDEGLFERASELAPYWEERAHALRGTPHIIDIRNLGMMAAIELQPRPNAPGARAMEAFHLCFDEGLLIRVTADIIALSPPLIVERSQIDQIFDKIADVLKRVS